MVGSPGFAAGMSRGLGMIALALVVGSASAGMVVAYLLIRQFS